MSAYSLGENLINSEMLENLNPVAPMLEMIRSTKERPVQLCTPDNSFCVMIMPMANVQPYRTEG